MIGSWPVPIPWNDGLASESSDSCFCWRNSSFAILGYCDIINLLLLLQEESEQTSDSSRSKKVIQQTN